MVFPCLDKRFRGFSSLQSPGRTKKKRVFRRFVQKDGMAHPLSRRMPHLTHISLFLFLQSLVATLSPEQIEYAAQSSYAYWLATFSEQPPTDAERLRMATREARRFLGNPYDVAMEHLHETCRFRKVCRGWFCCCFVKSQFQMFSFFRTHHVCVSCVSRNDASTCSELVSWRWMTFSLNL